MCIWFGSCLWPVTVVKDQVGLGDSWIRRDQDLSTNDIPVPAWWCYLICELYQVIYTLEIWHGYQKIGNGTPFFHVAISGYLIFKFRDQPNLNQDGIESMNRRVRSLAHEVPIGNGLRVGCLEVEWNWWEWNFSTCVFAFVMKKHITSKILKFSRECTTTSQAWNWNMQKRVPPGKGKKEASFCAARLSLKAPLTSDDLSWQGNEW